ncbi:cytochrome protein [Hypomontagnella monticulosa]|nr:cytochrome protein [Hypomontagnella monticulosa]
MVLLLLLVVAVVVFCYVTVSVVYRIYFHPLAKFPGPKLAAATGFYETYFDFALRPGGLFIHQVKKLHDIYGPIVRINPHEIHIDDPAWVDTLYINPSQGVREKYKPSSDLSGTPRGVFGTVGHEIHRKRRAAISSHFSKAAVTASVPMIYDKVELLFERMEKQICRQGYCEMRVNYFALATDTVADHCFADSTGLLQNEKAALDWHETIKALSRIMPLARQVSWVVPLALVLPVQLVEFCAPSLAKIVKLHHTMQDQARTAAMSLHEVKVDITSSSKPTRGGNVFHSILSNKALGQADKTYSRMGQEGIVLITAGGETTSRVLATATYHILANRKTILPLLQQELKSAIPNPKARVALCDLERLPFLTAIIKESLRIAAVVTSRLPLVAPNQTLRYMDWAIPSGVRIDPAASTLVVSWTFIPTKMLQTPVSMTLHNILLDPKIFNEPMEFRPSRWISSSPESSLVSSYFLPFGRGSRMCIGMSLAMAQIYITLASMFRRYDFELYDTIRERDLDIIRDCFLGEVQSNTKGVRIKYASTNPQRPASEHPE